MVKFKAVYFDDTEEVFDMWTIERGKDSLYMIDLTVWLWGVAQANDRAHQKGTCLKSIEILDWF